MPADFPWARPRREPVLLALVAVVAVRWLLRRFAGAGRTPYAMAGASAPGASQPMARSLPTAQPPIDATREPPALTGPLSAGAQQRALPHDFDAAAFERIAKTIFIRLQAANDAADLDDLRAFTTPELFASLRVDLHDRGAAAQRTDVVTLDAELLDFEQEADRQIVSVRFHGLLREDDHDRAEPFDEVWHLVRPGDNSRSWAIAGIQPMPALAA
jgi:predicted lipid-binding transport protein (Tim44 family)